MTQIEQLRLNKRDRTTESKDRRTKINNRDRTRDSKDRTTEVE